MRERLRPTLEFLRDLREHNEKAWFERQRPRYVAARAAFTEVVEELLGEFDAVDDLGGVSAEACLFRINRDMRFSANKEPYKSSMSAVLARGGRKPVGRSYYLHIEPDGRSFLAGGLYAPTAAELDRVRQGIARDASALKEIVAQPEFVRYFGALTGESLKTAPQGYAKDHPEIGLLRMKQFIAQRPLSDEETLAEDFVAQAVEVCRALKPLLVYLEAQQSAAG